jgi:hypothetical protein
MRQFYLRPPKELCENIKDYCGWILSQYEQQARFGEGGEDIITAKQDGYNLNCIIQLAVWQACRERFDYSKTQNFTTRDLIDIIRTKEWSHKIEFDRTRVCHLVGILRALGLVYRMRKGAQQEYEYAFEDVILEKGMDWFLKDNPFIHNPPPLGGFLDDCLRK